MSLGITWSCLKALHSVMLAEAKPSPRAVAAALSWGAHQAEARLLLCPCCCSAGATSVPAQGIFGASISLTFSGAWAVAPPYGFDACTLWCLKQHLLLGICLSMGGTESWVGFSWCPPLQGAQRDPSNSTFSVNEPRNTQLMLATQCERTYLGWKCDVIPEDEL